MNQYEYSDMEILQICLKSRYPFNSKSFSRLSSLLLLPTRRSLYSCTKTLHIRHYVASSFASEVIQSAARFGLHRNHEFRLFSTRLSDLSSSEATAASKGDDVAELELNAPNFVIESIVDVISRNGVDMEFWLDSIGKDISIGDVNETLKILNRLGLNALRFFNWIQNKNSQISCDPIVCSLMVNNCGRLGDYKTMLTLLKDFGEKRILLNDEAFSFLCSLCSRNEELRCSVERLVKILKEVNGTCYYSGINALIRTCCAMNQFELSKFVVDMNKTEAVYYRVWLREICLKGRYQEAQQVLNEMKQIGCDLDTRTYNYLISCLWKHGMLDQNYNVLEGMIETGCPVNAITFEILICRFCQVNELESAVKSYEIMVSHGIEPRLSTCSAIIKAYFKTKRYDEAYEYLMHVSVNQKCLINALYSLLANLHRKQGDVVVAYNLLMEMIKMGLKPDFSVYVNVSKKLYNRRRKDLAGILKDSYTHLVQQSSNK